MPLDPATHSAVSVAAHQILCIEYMEESIDRRLCYGEMLDPPGGRKYPTANLPLTEAIAWLLVVTLIVPPVITTHVPSITTAAMALAMVIVRALMR